MLNRPESLQSSHSDQILLHPCFGCCLSAWNMDRRKRLVEEKDGLKCCNTEMLCSKSRIWVKFWGDSISIFA